MPLYEYKCSKYKLINEKIFKTTKFPKTIKCVNCGGRAKKIISLFLKTIKDILVSLGGGELYVVKKEIALEYEQVKSSLDTIAEKCFRGEDNFLRFEGKDADWLEENLPIQYRFYDKEDSNRPLVLSQVAARFFLDGGKWEDISNYDCVKTYGRLHEKKRRLKIV